MSVLRKLHQASMVFVVMLFAYLVNTGSRFWMINVYIDNIVFWLICVVSFLLFTLYSFVLVIAYILFFEHRNPLGDPARRGRLALWYLISVAVPLLLLHFMAVKLLFRVADSSVWDSSFPTEGFPIFVLFMLLQSFLLQLRPLWHPIYLPAIHLRSSMIAYGISRRVEYPTARVSISERVQDLVEKGSIPDNMKRLLAKEVVLLIFNKYGRCYTVDGSRHSMKSTSVVLSYLLVSGWFVEIRRGVWLNVWYFVCQKRKKILVRADGELSASVLEHIADQERCTVAELSGISKGLKSKVVSHLQHRASFPEDWADQYIDLGERL
ncbi:hypothetical protein [Sphingobacterium tabacisoli]|uniref:Uncharacterized protein n=1 Tax=Sphingobacterium tabacisoli TaxID=2044855 RepID=A0ABW5KZP6_9SPHI|nr:hypothetical protein [Sphingobacterium tabacisoli]